LTRGKDEARFVSEGAYSMCKRSERREKVKRKMMDFYKIHPCVDCGEADPRVLDFDHLNNKIYNISTLISKEYCWETILDEASKCEIRCANCHRIKTAVQQNHYTNRLLKEYFGI
jgi:diphthamide synthase (EF-2-diphthine--ammonia ligase)